MAKRLAIWLAAGLLSAAPLAGASAAPQILAALPSLSGIPITCDDIACKAEISTYCLMRNRPAPSLGARYVPAAPEHFTLVVTDAGGNERSLPAGEHLTFVESRGFMAVAAVTTLAALEELGAVKAVVRVSKTASLLPVPVPGDPNPLTPKEIAYATGSLRTQGAEIVETRPAAATARVLAAVTNRLPFVQEFDTGEFEALWGDLIDSIPAGSVDQAAIGAARAKADACAGDVRNLLFRSLRGCLQWRHDELIRELNVDYWDSQVGS